MQSGKLFISSEESMLELGKKISQLLPQPVIIFLDGDLGAGKTTLSRGILFGLGHNGKVKSPTYTLVEDYDLPLCKVFHFDLYRLQNPEELDEIGMQDYLATSAITIIEWPEKGSGWLPIPDLSVKIEIIPSGRQLILTACTSKGIEILGQLNCE